MTALPEPQGHPWLAMPDHLLTLEEYLSLGETESGYTELVEGRLHMSPSPRRAHNVASLKLAVQLIPQLPGDLEVVQDIDIDLGGLAGNGLAFSRRPDLVVVSKAAGARLDAEGGIYKASEVVVVVEIVSPGSKRTDYVTKHGEYADAGIPHYWIVDLADRVSLVACHQAGVFGYQDAPAATGTFTTTEPFPLKLDLDQLGS
ncbi:Uma2 family endonuclease [Amycolatopsis sp. NPDC059657]|uniref:Uma2 family endonuclease n=1 Tax=Amycolatopsis sp. NPDC059657 TaxID=3346899 RepID=UPI003671BAC9